MSFGEEGSHAWAWQEEFVDGDSSLAISQLLNDFDLTQSEEVSRNLFENAQIDGYAEPECPVSSGGSQGSRDLAHSSRLTASSPKLKRRRVVQFAAESLSDHQIGGFESCGNSLADQSEDFQTSDLVGWDSFMFCRNEDLSCESFDQSSESWMAGCFNDREIPDNLDSPNAPSGFDDQLSEFCNLLQSAVDAEMSPEKISNSSSTVLTEKKKTSTKLATAVAYPFAIIKPCGGQGDVTLDDINQKISSSSSPLLQVQGGALSQPLQNTSAFSGKAVVSCTKIQTEGSGNIIIMRTRG